MQKISEINESDLLIDLSEIKPNHPNIVADVNMTKLMQTMLALMATLLVGE